MSDFALLEAHALEASWADESELYRVVGRPLLGLTLARIFYLSGPARFGPQLICRFARRTPERARAEAQAVIDGEQDLHSAGRPARVTWILAPRRGRKEQ